MVRGEFIGRPAAWPGGEENSCRAGRGHSKPCFPDACPARKPRELFGAAGALPVLMPLRFPQEQVEQPLRHALLQTMGGRHLRVDLGQHGLSPAILGRQPEPFLLPRDADHAAETFGQEPQDFGVEFVDLPKKRREQIRRYLDSGIASRIN